MKTEDLLHKYVTHGLSDGERFELEKRALEDDFLAEAWEGLQVHQGSDLHKKWNAIQSEWNNKTLDSQKVETKVVAMRPWMRYVAAAAVLLLGATLFFTRSADRLPNEESYVALDPIEVDNEQEMDATSHENEEQADISNLEEYEDLEEEKRLKEKTSKIRTRSKTSIQRSDTEVAPIKKKAPNPTEKEVDVAFVTKSKAQKTLTERKNAVVSSDPVTIPNSTPEVEGRAAIEIDAKVEDYGNVDIVNADRTAIIATIESEDRPDANSGQLFDQVKKESAEAGQLKFEEPQSDKKNLINLDDRFTSSALKERGLKKQIIANKKSKNSADAVLPTLQKARDLFLKNKDYQGARDEAKRVIALNSTIAAEGYELIGDIYAAASETCGPDKWSHSLAVLAAYDQYTQAKNLTNNSAEVSRLGNIMTQLRDRFPTKDEGFMRGAKLGEKVVVPCWIGEMVNIRYK